MISIVPKDPKLGFIIHDQIDLFGPEKVQSLKILYDTTDLQKSKLNVTIYKIALVNSGRKNVSKNDFDDKVGIVIKNGSIIEPLSILESSSDFLEKSFPSCKIDSVIFPAISFDKKESIMFRLVIMHKNSESPELIPIGKISGQKSIIIRANTNKESALDNLSDYKFLSLLFAILCCLLAMVLSCSLHRELIRLKHAADEIHGVQKSYEENNKNKH